MSLFPSRCVAALAAGAACAPLVAQTVTPLPVEGVPTGISGDGTVVVGHTPKPYRAFRLDPKGLTYLDEPAPVLGAFAASVSPNGVNVAGSQGYTMIVCGGTSPSLFTTPVAWLGGPAPIDIGLLAGDNAGSAFGVSDTGVVCGVSAARQGAHRTCLSADHAFVWTREVGLTPLVPAAPISEAVARAISADGVTVAGTGETNVGERAFVWTAAGGMRVLPVPTTNGTSAADDISDNGEQIAGRVNGRACLWVNEAPAMMLGALPGEAPTVESTARFISGDGSTVVGRATVWLDGFPPQTDVRSFIWDRVRGMRELRTALVEEFGVPLEGVFVPEVSGLSRTGRYMIADGAIDGERAPLLIDLGRPAACIADADLNGLVNSDDFFALLAAFFAVNADVNEDGTTSSEDFFEFLSAFFGGC